MNKYENAFYKIPKLALALFALTLLLKLVAFVLARSFGHTTAFDDAVNLLMHYPDSIKAVFAFFSAVLFFLCVTLAFEPSDLGRIGRRWVFIPSLQVTEHMFTLAIGVFAANAIIETLTNGVPFDSPFKTIVAVIFFSVMLGALATLCSVVAEFLINDFDKAVSLLGAWRFVVLFIIASVLIWAIFQDAVWNYKPSSLTSH